jgi:hypothetical protein
MMTYSGSGKAPSMVGIARSVVQKDGVLGLWAGLRPNIARTFLVNAAELGTYDQAKSMLVSAVGEGPVAHIGASGIAGVTSALTSTPADVVKTRLMNDAGGQQRYTGMIHATRTIFAEEGASALYAGFYPIGTHANNCASLSLVSLMLISVALTVMVAVVRKVAWCTAFFVCFEQVKSLVDQSGDTK